MAQVSTTVQFDQKELKDLVLTAARGILSDKGGGGSFSVEFRQGDETLPIEQEIKAVVSVLNNSAKK